MLLVWPEGDQAAIHTFPHDLMNGAVNIGRARLFISLKMHNMGIHDTEALGIT